VTCSKVPPLVGPRPNAADFRAFDPQASEKPQPKKAARARILRTRARQYTVILDPRRSRSRRVSLLRFLRHAIQDQRSCFSGRLGKPLLGKNITNYDDVYHPDNSVRRSMAKAFPARGVLVDDGVPRNLVYSRRSAKKAGTRPRPQASPCQMNMAKRR